MKLTAISLSANKAKVLTIIMKNIRISKENPSLKSNILKENLGWKLIVIPVSDKNLQKKGLIGNKAI
jgi:hypothetical protein